jgi:ribosomal peptide maturation radical SAM protein 1
MKTEVALVNMPFYGIDRPSLGLSLLKAALNKRNIPCDVHYLNLCFAHQIGVDRYKLVDALAETDLAGEWIFSAALWGEDQALDKAYIREVLQERSPYRQNLGLPISGKASTQLGGYSPELTQLLRTCRNHVEPFLERCLTDIDWNQYRVVGFTSMFQQQLASLALATRLKQWYPHLLIAFGGPNCEGRMGLAHFRAFPFIDVVCTGEGDGVFPDFVERVLKGNGIAHPNLLCRNGEETHHTPHLELIVGTDSLPSPPVTVDLDSLPYPDFDDFFEQREKYAWSIDEDVKLLIETSRGCWWGEISNCTFCSLNGTHMVFRHKSANRAVQEILWLVQRYGKFSKFIHAVDNILPVEYFASVLPTLKDLALNVDLFYETKSNLKKDQIELCSNAGVKYLQPGIESLSTPILGLMGKGVTSLQNIQFLKWARQFGICLRWNYLIGFPGEQWEHYNEQVKIIESIVHLQPPHGEVLCRVRFDRFSPYVAHPQQFGIHNLRPYPSYRYVYPGISDDILQDLAYYFVCDFEGQDRVDDYTTPLADAVRKWHSSRDNCALFSITIGPRVFVCDLRPHAKRLVTVLTGVPKRILMECDAICSRTKLLDCVVDELGKPISERTLDKCLGALLRQKIILEQNGKYLALAIPLGYRYVPERHLLDRVLRAVESELETSSATAPLANQA